LFTGDLPHSQKQTLALGEKLEEDLPSQWPPKTGRSSKTYKEGHSILIKGKYTKRK
jgi:hypothetical protein